MVVSFQLASYWERWAARFIDTIILVVAWYISRPLLDAVSDRIVVWLLVRTSVGVQFTFAALVITVFIFLMALYSLCNWVYLKRDGQSIGKKLMKIQIVRMDGSLPPLHISLLKRDLSFFLLYLAIILISVFFIRGFLQVGDSCFRLFLFIDTLFIFSEGRRCLHDRFAGTRVVKFDPMGSGKRRNDMEWQNSFKNRTGV